MSLRKRRTIAIVLAGLFLGFVGLVGTVYAAAQVPLPGDTANPQATIIEYADGSQMTTIHKENRIEIPLSQVPEHVRDAVLAAEDRGFYEHSGISVSGIARALYQDVRGGGAKQGGSTITQQYARNAFLSQERTVARKFREAIIAVKLERQHSKDQILEWYLNTIYFGRGASGIETASRTYFGVPTKRLTVEQAAVLAALIRSPEGGDPASDPELAKKRWDSVLAGLVEMKKMTREEADRAKYPKIRPRRAAGKGGAGDGPIGHVREAVKAELKRIGFSESEIDTGGLRVRTTIDKKRQEAAVNAVHGILKDPKNDPHAALAAVEPGTGKVVAMYGGRDWGGKGSRNSFINWAVQKRQTGSAYKPFVLAAALDDGISVKSRFDGKSPQTFAGNYTVNNFDSKQFGRIDLVEATANSVNTVYVALGLEVGVDKVIDTANRMGLPEECKENRDGSLFLGTCDQRPVDMAAGFATFANKGESTGWHLVESVRSPKNKNVYKAKVEKTEALSDGEAADAIHALRAVVENGTARGAQIGRPAAGKTGTTQDNQNALFSGFVPQLSATVWMGYEFREDDGTGKRGFPQMKNLYGYSEITGGTLPARIWQAFMSAALEGVPVENFPPPVFGGKVTGTPTPTPSATPSETPSPTPTTATPTPTAEPTFVITPEPTKTNGTGAPQPSPTETTTSPPPPEESVSPAPVASPAASGGP
ncbi:MAG TPA: transglycosylase domain-containing protein [Frankiaceae bacterium]|nr:transglycosylase domain-containing protein [Frankiaceae bacterium]